MYATLVKQVGSGGRRADPFEPKPIVEKSADAFRTISEVSEEVDLPQHVLRFWETRFPQIKPLKRAGGRRYYRPSDIALLKAIRTLLYDEGYTIKGVQRLLKEQGAKGLGLGADLPAPIEPTFGGVVEGPILESDAETMVGGSLAPSPSAVVQTASTSPNRDLPHRTDAEEETPLIKEPDLLREALEQVDACTAILAAVRAKRR